MYRAPGRVNLIGEHTDYNGGFVLPIAIGLETRVAARTVRKRELRVRSRQMEGEAALPLAALAAARKQGHWTDYVFGVARELVHAGFEVKPLELEIDSTVPTGSGLSSSAALEVSSALALLQDQPVGKLELAKLCQRAEREFVGMPCGIMDQYVSVHGEPGKAVLIDCRSITHRLAPLPPSIAIVAVNTMVKHELGASAYRQRVAECAEALRHFPGKSALRDVTFEELERASPRMAEIPLARARHVILEDARVEQFIEACAKNDLERMGRLFVESHRSLRDDYEVSCEELDTLVGLALRIEGCYGARMTGGGFGGCTVNLVALDQADRFEAEIATRYHGVTGLTPAVYRCTPSAGAGPVTI